MSHHSRSLSVVRRLSILRIAGRIVMPKHLRLAGPHTRQPAGAIQIAAPDATGFKALTGPNTAIRSHNEIPLLSLRDCPHIAGRCTAEAPYDIDADAKSRESLGPLSDRRSAGRPVSSALRSWPAGLRMRKSAVNARKTVWRYWNSEAVLHLGMHMIVIGGMVWLAYTAGYAGSKVVDGLDTAAAKQTSIVAYQEELKTKPDESVAIISSPPAASSAPSTHDVVKSTVNVRGDAEKTAAIKHRNVQDKAVERMTLAVNQPVPPRRPANLGTSTHSTAPVQSLSVLTPIHLARVNFGISATAPEGSKKPAGCLNNCQLRSSSRDTPAAHSPAVVRAPAAVQAAALPREEPVHARFANAVLHGGRTFLGQAANASSAVINTGKQALLATVDTLW